MGKLALTAKEQEMLELARETGNTAIEEMILKKGFPTREKTGAFIIFRTGWTADLRLPF